MASSSISHGEPGSGARRLSLASAPAMIRPTGKVRDLLMAIEDETLRERVAQVVQHTLQALHELGRIHLPQDNLETTAAAVEGDRHIELAPYVFKALLRINGLLQYLAETFPAPAAEESSSEGDAEDDDFDLAFDLVDGPTGEGEGLSGGSSDTPGTSELSGFEAVADAAHAFGGMLRVRTTKFGERLEAAIESEGDWPILAELDDYKHRLIKATQAVLFGVLAVFSNDVRREEILPEYRSAVAESVGLRKAVVELGHHVERCNGLLAGGSADRDIAVPLMVALSERLGRFAASSAYGMLRADDKRAVIGFRGNLYQMRQDKNTLNVVALHRLVEGFSKFLESMGAINHREVLIVHDQQRLQEAHARLDHVAAMLDSDPPVARREFAGLMVALDAVIGRCPPLDDARRRFLGGGTLAEVEADGGDEDDLHTLIPKWYGLLGQAMAMAR